MAALAPYLWQYPMALDGRFASMGRFACQQLAEHTAAYSPDPTMAVKPRKFGLIVQYDESSDRPDPSPLSQELARCGVSLAYSTELQLQQPASAASEGQSDASYEAETANAVAQMNAAGVTTGLCFCSGLIEEGVPAAADAQHYYPEWLLTGLTNDWDWAVKAFWPNADQQRALMGMTFYPAQVPFPDTTLNWALNAVDPGYQDDASDASYAGDQVFYQQMLLIASGIQMAGPDLTPYSFERGLQQAHFPNPFSPEQEGAAQFGGGSHSMTVDASVMWWSDSAPDPFGDGAGTWCYTEAGRRFDLRGWPGGPIGLFQAPCYNSPLGPAS